MVVLFTKKEQSRRVARMFPYQNPKLKGGAFKMTIFKYKQLQNDVKTKEIDARGYDKLKSKALVDYYMNGGY